MNLITKRLNYFYKVLLKVFVRANFNSKSNEFNSLHEFNPVIFFNDTISNEINIDGFYEKDQLDIIKPFLKKDIFLDIGANLGNHTLYFNKFFKNIYSFEPHPLTFKLLEINTKYKPHINIFNFGLSKKQKKTNVTIESQNNMGGQDFKKNNDDGKINQEVFFKNFDEIFDFKDQISFIKIDVEGNELDVLKSMNKNLINNQAIICLEFDIKNFSEKNEIIIFLKNAGYNFFYYFETNKMLELRIRNLFSIFFKIVFFGFTEKIRLRNVNNFNKNKYYKNQNILISKNILNIK
jgi:FkbM family methyltransferase